MDAAKFSLNYENELEYIYETLVEGTCDYFSKNGFNRAVLGLSGGLDSAVAAVLLADALGAENVYGLAMPSSITHEGSNDEAFALAQNLGINYIKVPVNSAVEAVEALCNGAFSEMAARWNETPEEKITAENLQARMRATLLWQTANAFKGTIPIATSDKSEIYIGYTTVNGDMSGGLAPLAEVTKTKVRALARWMNLNRANKNAPAGRQACVPQPAGSSQRAIPENTIMKPSSAELSLHPETGKSITADEANGPEAFRDEIIWRIENRLMIEGEYLAERMARGEFEPQNIYEQDALNQLKNFTSDPISDEDKEKWIEHFFTSAKKAIFKRSILPPCIIIPPRK